jgi:hypothetical protein
MRKGQLKQTPPLPLTWGMLKPGFNMLKLGFNTEFGTDPVAVMSLSCATAVFVVGYIGMHYNTQTLKLPSPTCNPPCPKPASRLQQ